MSNEPADRLELMCKTTNPALLVSVLKGELLAAWEAIAALRSEPVAWSAHGIKREDTCIWMQDSDGLWNTSCGKVFEFTNEGPAENEANFCYHCGGALLPEPYSDAAPSRETAKRSATSTQEGLGRLWNAQTAKPEAEPALSAEQIEVMRVLLIKVGLNPALCDMALSYLTARPYFDDGERVTTYNRGVNEGIEAAAKACNPDANGWNNTSDRHIAYSIRDKILALKGQP